MISPVLRTGRLTLRARRVDDFDAYAAFFASPRSGHEDGPMDRDAEWKEFAANAGLWLLRGYGALSIEETATGRYCGETGLFHPDDSPEPEIGWILMEHAEGRGIAHEAAAAVRDWAFAVHPFPSLVNYIAPENARSIRLAERLGAVRDDAAPLPQATGPCVCYRHARPEAAQ